MEYSFLKDVCSRYGAQIIFNCALAPYTSFKIGGKCDALIKANCAELIAEVVKECKSERIPFHVIGKGSNVLISDKGLRGIVIVISSSFSEISKEGNVLYCEAGASLAKLCVYAKEHSLTGLEFAYGIPGTAGGALYMNAGAYGGEIADVIRSCRYLDADGEIKEMTAAEMGLSYRRSVFTDSGGIILGLWFALQEGDEEVINRRMEEVMEKRRDKQPLEYPSAGSTFKRPAGDYAARLIDDCGLKGFSVGGAEVSRKHSGFVINRCNATFEDVMGVIEGVKAEVLRRSGIALECEVKILGK